MPPYDSDSSGDEDNDYTLTNVLLGYAAKEARDDEISQLGGRPTWIDSSFPPSAALAKCKVCNDLMTLLLQLNGELPDFPGHERRLYVLTCRRKTCRRKEGSVRVLRGVRISEVVLRDKSRSTGAKPKAEIQPSPTPTNFGETLFGAKPSSHKTSANPFSSGSSVLVSSNPFSTPSSAPPKPQVAKSESEAPKPKEIPPQSSSDLPKTFASALSLNNNTPAFGPPPPPEPWPQELELPTAYPSYFLDPDYEELDKAEDVTIPSQAMEVDEGSGSGSQKEEKDAYEDKIDRTFQKFADRLAQNPEQVIRYEFKGHPLLYSKTDVVGKLLSGSGNFKVTTSSGSGNRIPRCSNCGAGRVFEVQLTPHAITELEREESGLDGMEWGTIIVGVCEKDCQQKGVNSGVGYLEEWAGVQWEELRDQR